MLCSYEVFRALINSVDFNIGGGPLVELMYLNCIYYRMSLKLRCAKDITEAEVCRRMSLKLRSTTRCLIMTFTTESHCNFDLLLNVTEAENWLCHHGSLTLTYCPPSSC